MTQVIRLRYIIGVALALSSAARLQSQEPTHDVGTGAQLFAPAPPSVLEARLQGAVQKYAGREVLRMTEFDVAFPRDSAEFVQMAGNAVLLIVAVTVDSSDLPLTGVYAAQGSQHTTLAPVHVHTYVVPPGTYKTVLGRNRMDAFFLIPARVWRQGADLLADFRSRKAFALGFVSGPDGYSYPSVDPGAVPSDSAIASLLAREYPGFVAH